MIKYYAKINKNNIVEQVIVSETKKWVNDNKDGDWIETFIDSKSKKYAGVGWSYYRNTKNFYPPKPYESWILDSNLEWQAPISIPKDGKVYEWNEELVDWIKTNLN